MNLAIIALTETFLNERIDNSLFQLNNYNLFRRGRSSGIGGGTTLDVCNKMFLAWQVDVKTNLCELLCVDCVSKLNKTIVLRCIVYYRSSVSNLHEMSEFCSLLCNLSDSCKNLLLLGDFNLPLINRSLYIPTVDDSLYDIFLTTVLKLKLFQHVNMPSRGENYLDLMLSNDKI